MSNMLLTPAQITVTSVYPNSIKSAEMSKVFSAFLWTPPSPPVTKISIPDSFAIIIVAATVVDPFYFFAIQDAKSLLLHFLHYLPSLAKYSSYSFSNPTHIFT